MRAQEHWTRSRRALVVTGEPETVKHLINELEIKNPLVVSVSENRDALPLWGSALTAYLQNKHLLNTNAKSLKSGASESAVTSFAASD